MKANFYISTFNFNVMLSIFSTITVGISLLLPILAQPISLHFADIANSLISFSILLRYISFIFFGLLFSFVAFEMVNRFKKDSIGNYLKSVLQTFQLRQFLKQIERSDVATLVGQTRTIRTYNPIIRNFNRTIRRSVIDIRKDKILVDIHIPSGQQAQKILNEMTTDIREILTRMNPDYYFSSPSPTVNHLYFEGTKR